jgi:superfamily II DNA or RNA helicase
MSNKLKDAIYRIGEPGLQSILGDNVVQIAKAIDEKYSKSKYLSEMLIEIYQFDLLLLNKGIRSEIIFHLKLEDAAELAEDLKCLSREDPYTSINNISFSKNTTQIQILYRFFEVEYYSDDESLPSNDTLAITKIIPDYSLYAYQKEAVHRALTIINSVNDGKVLMHMPTGSGKTRSAMHLICRILANTNDGLVVWLAHSEELCNQSAEEFERAWKAHGNREIDITRYYGEYDCDIGTINDGFLISSLSKLYKRSFSEQSSFLRMQKNVQLVVIDEAHQAIAETYKHLLEMLLMGNQVKLLGLSATPGRSLRDIEKDEMLANFFNRKKVTLDIEGYGNPIDFLIKEGYLASPKYTYFEYKSDNMKLSKTLINRMNEGMDIDRETLVKIGKDLNRNLLVIEMIEDLIKRHKKIIVFGTSVEQSDLISSMLKVMKYKAKSLTSKHSSLYRKNVISSFKSNEDDSLNILINYGILTTGFDAPNASAAVIARPTQSVVLYSQMVGRVLRGIKSGGNKNCEIYTVVDKIKGFRSIYEGFSHWDDVWVD